MSKCYTPEKLFGLDIDLGNHLAETLGTHACFCLHDFNELLDEERPKAHLVISGVSITPERTKSHTFVALPYATFGKCILTHRRDLAGLSNLFCKCPQEGRGNGAACRLPACCPTSLCDGHTDPVGRRLVVLSESTSQKYVKDRTRFDDVPISRQLPFIEDYIDLIEEISPHRLNTKKAYYRYGNGSDNYRSRSIALADNECEMPDGVECFDGLLTDYPTCVAVAAKTPNEKLHVMLSLEDTERLGIIVLDDDPKLLHWLDHEVRRLLDNGMLKGWQQKWLITDEGWQGACDKLEWRTCER